MPPSRLLSAFRAIRTYFTVDSSVSVQRMQEMVPSTTSSVTGRLTNTPRTVECGEVPISPYTMPRAMSVPAAETRLSEVLADMGEEFSEHLKVH